MKSLRPNEIPSLDKCYTLFSRLITMDSHHGREGEREMLLPVSVSVVYWQSAWQATRVWIHWEFQRQKIGHLVVQSIMAIVGIVRETILGRTTLISGHLYLLYQSFWPVWSCAFWKPIKEYVLVVTGYISYIQDPCNNFSSKYSRHDKMSPSVCRLTGII